MKYWIKFKLVISWCNEIQIIYQLTIPIGYIQVRKSFVTISAELSQTHRTQTDH